MKPILNVTQLTFQFDTWSAPVFISIHFEALKWFHRRMEQKLQSGYKVIVRYAPIIFIWFLRHSLWSAGYIMLLWYTVHQLTLTSFGIVSAAIAPRHNILWTFWTSLFRLKWTQKKISQFLREMTHFFPFSVGKRREIGIWFEPTTDFDDSFSWF